MPIRTLSDVPEWNIDDNMRRWIAAEYRRERSEIEDRIKDSAPPPFPSLDVEISADDDDAAEAGRWLVRLDEAVNSLAKTGSDPGEINARLKSREAVCSSHIEGEATWCGWFDAAVRFLPKNHPRHSLHGSGSAEDSRDFSTRAATVLRCAESTELMMRSQGEVEEIKNCHRLLMGGTDAKPGRFRGKNDLVWIGNGGKVKYVPPLGGPAITRMVSELGVWTQEQRRRAGKIGSQEARYAHMAAASGVAHLRFESIHPFVDGNGRTGRSLAEGLIAAWRPSGVLTAPIGVASAFSEGDVRRGYYDALSEYRDDPLGFARWWCRQVTTAAKTAIETSEQAPSLSTSVR